MKTKAVWKRVTNIKVTAYDLEGNIKDVTEIHNLITTVGLGMLIDLMDGGIADGEIKYMGVGSDNTAPALADTTLGTETFRKAMTTQTQPTATSLLSTVYVSPSEAVGVIEEIGWFAGVGAGAGADTGIMIARVLYSRVKTTLESLQIERTDSIAEA